MKQANIGFIGAGQFVSGVHLPTTHGCNHMRVYAIADLNEDLLAGHATSYRPHYTTTDYRRLLDDAHVQIVVIGTRQDSHAQLIVEALEAGKWVYCEKPMAETPSEVRAVLDAEARSPGRLAIGLNRRFAPACVDARRLMKTSPRPWMLIYRLMAPHLTTGDKDDFYRERPRILYEGCHVLDLLCWFLEADPVRVHMIGDPLRNNSCLLEFPDGSQVTFVCGSMGSLTMTKEYMEVFSQGRAITVSDFVDMRVRGFEDAHDRQYPLDSNAYADEIRRFGFDFYEVCRSQEIANNPESVDVITAAGMVADRVRRPLSGEAVAAAKQYDRCRPPYFDNPDKGRRQALEGFVNSFLNGTIPDNADGVAGARSTQLAMALLESLETGTPTAYESFVTPRG